MTRREAETVHDPQWKALAERCEEWKALAGKLEALLAYYRVGRRPSGKLLDEIAALKRRLGT